MQKIELDAASWLVQGNLPDIDYSFDELWDLHPLEFGKVIMFDKVVSTPRWQQNYCLPYWFSGMKHAALELPDQFKPFLHIANNLSFGEFNQVLINWYGDGNHYIGAHSDGEPQIVAISLGTERTFRIRNKSSKAIVVDIPLADQTFVDNKITLMRSQKLQAKKR